MWFVGDLTNLYGALWAGLVPTVIILALYFCLADAILITQCLYYNHINGRRKKIQMSTALDPEDPHQPLLHRTTSDVGLPGSRRRSSTSQGRRGSSLKTPTLPVIAEGNGLLRSRTKNTLSALLVCAAGASGWAIAWSSGLWMPTVEDSNKGTVHDIVGAEILGYLSAACYLG